MQFLKIINPTAIAKQLQPKTIAEYIHRSGASEQIVIEEAAKLLKKASPENSIIIQNNVKEFLKFRQRP